jgi:hypothetical protein
MGQAWTFREITPGVFEYSAIGVWCRWRRAPSGWLWEASDHQGRAVFGQWDSNRLDAFRKALAYVYHDSGVTPEAVDLLYPGPFLDAAFFMG